MDGTESASGGEEREPPADDGTSTSRDDNHKNGDALGGGDNIPQERPITPGQNADPEAHTLELIAKYIGMESVDVQLPEDGVQKEDTAQEKQESNRDEQESVLTKQEPFQDQQDNAQERHEPVQEKEPHSEGETGRVTEASKSESETSGESPTLVPPEETGDKDGEPEEKENGLGLDMKDLEAPTSDDHNTTDPAVVIQDTASAFSSPETKVSGVISDPGDSFGSPHGETGKESEQETDGENNIVAQYLVKEVLSKALMINSDSDTSLNSEQDLDGIAPADQSKPDGEAGIFAEDGKDGDAGNQQANIGVCISASDAEVKADQPANQSSSEESNGETGPEEVTKKLVSRREDGYDESSPEAERVIEVQVLEDEDEGDFEVEGEEEVKLVSVESGSPHPEYPMNYGNYKVCRQVAPGVKECLILETGEFVKYDRKKKRSASSLSPSTSPKKSDDESTRRSLSESSGGSPKSDTEGEKKAFKIVKTPPTVKGTVFMSLKLQGKDQVPNTANLQEDVDSAVDYLDERHQVISRDEFHQDEDGETSRQGNETQDDTQEVSGAEAEQISDVLETSPEEIKSESKTSHVRDRQESKSTDTSTRGILKPYDEPPYRHGTVKPGSPVSPSKPPMSPRLRPHLGQRYREPCSPPRRAYDDSGRIYDNMDRNQHLNTSDYGGSLSGSYLTGRSQTFDRDYQSLPSHVPRINEKRYLYQPEVVTSPPSSGPVPGYNTLRDQQQVSWLKMFKLLENEHRTELRAQYAEHQRLIQDIQDQMERELRKQQSSIQQRLDSHREILRDTSPLADRVLNSLNTEEYRRPVSESCQGRLVDYSSGDSAEEQEKPYTSPQRSRSEFEKKSNVRSPLSDRRVFYEEQENEYLVRPSTSLPVRRSLERDFDSPACSSDRGHVSMDTGYLSPRRSGVYDDSNESRSRPNIPDDRLLRGGVYSSPMPLSKLKHANRSSSSFVKKSFSESHRSTSPPPLETSHTTDRPFDLRPRKDLSWREDSELLTESVHDDSNLSMSTRVNLREKHAKHLSDLREYYEAEMAELRAALSRAQPANETAHERILHEENQALRLRCQEMNDLLHDSKVRIRDLEQKLQGLEVRANDYSARYDESQRSVLALKGRIDELHIYIKDKDNLCADLDAKVKKQSKALQEAYKHQNDLTESNRRDKEALKRLQDKYDNLEKDHEIMTSRVADGDKKVHLAHEEIASLNKTIAKLELHNKQLARENENLKHKAAIALNMASVRTSYEESYGHQVNSTDTNRSRPPRHMEINGPMSAPTYRSMERLYVSEPEGQHRVESSQESDEESEIDMTSPLIKAEQELRRLQNSSRSASVEEFKPRLQKKYYGSEITYPGQCRNTASTSALDSSRSQSRSPRASKPTNSPKSKSKSRNISRSETHLNSVAITNGVMSPNRTSQPRMKLKPKEVSTATRFDISFNDLPNEGTRLRSQNGSSSSTVSIKKPENKVQSLESTLSRVRSGDIVSRPEWEDINTSMVQPPRPRTPPRQTMTKEERLKDRLATVDRLERRYDELQAEKRRLESALNKIPIHGRTRKLIQSQEELETNLEKVDREIGSVRMSLKRYQVLKSTI